MTTENDKPAPQPAPSPTTIHVPPGTWALIVTDENDQPHKHGDTVDGPANLTISIAAPD